MYDTDKSSGEVIRPAAPERTSGHNAYKNGGLEHWKDSVKAIFLRSGPFLITRSGREAHDMSNLDIRTYAISKQVKHWRIAERLGKSDSNFSRMLRKELPDDKKREIISIIDELAK